MQCIDLIIIIIIKICNDNDELSAPRQVHWFIMPTGDKMSEVVTFALLTDNYQ